MKSYKKLLLIGCILCIIQMFFLTVKAEKLTGTAEEIQWEYDDETKTLTFSGKGRIPDGGSWDDWNAGEEMLWEYKKAEIEHIVINEGITEIGNTTFNIMPNLKNVKLCKSLEVIGVMAFEHASNLESIELPENLKVIESSAFEDCIKLKNIVLPGSLEYILNP